MIRGKPPEFRTTVTRYPSSVGCPVVYCNVIGGNDELIFDGCSVVASAKGEVIAGLPAFREELRVVDLTAQLHPAEG